MLKLIDNIYFNLRSILRDPNEMWNAGFAAGQEVKQAAILAELSEKSLHGFSDPSLTLGYAHAVTVVKGEVK
jgi:hypothetical protein